MAHDTDVSAEEPILSVQQVSHMHGRGQLKIGVRLTVCFAAIAILMIGGDAVAVWQIGRVEALSRRSFEAEQSSLAVMRLYLDIVTFRETLTDLANAQDRHGFALQAVALRELFLEDGARAQQALNLTFDSEMDSTVLTKLQTVRDALPSQVDLMLELAKANDWQAVRLRLASQVKSLALSSSSLAEDVDGKVALARTRALKSTEQARQERLLVLAAAAMLILALSGLLGWNTTRAICRPLARLDVAARALARGDFHHEVEVNGADELSELGRTFNYAATQLREQKKTEEALRRAQAEIAHIHRVTTMGELTASLAHEIRQPISAAVNYAMSCSRWLARPQPDLEQAYAAAARIVEYLKSTESIISRIHSLFHKGEPQREDVDVNEVIREMILLLRSAANQQSISIRTQTADNLPRVTADRVQLQQVLMNLMLNGMEAMKGISPPGELTIRSQAEDGELLFSVSDTGVGLPVENLDRMFKAFYTTKPEGTGMGLAISRSIIEAHGGRLWASSDGNRGATFKFTLPFTVDGSSPLRV